MGSVISSLCHKQERRAEVHHYKLSHRGLLGREPDFDDKSMLIDSPKPSKRRMLAKCVSPMLGFDHHSISQNFINNAYNFVKELSHSRLGSVYKATKRTQSGDYQQDKY